jgi:hypothetical protein
MFGWKKSRADAQAGAKNDAEATDAASESGDGASGDAVGDARIAAVIAAAVAAYQGGGAAAARDIVYRKIDRAAGPRTEWNLAGLREILENRGL